MDATHTKSRYNQLSPKEFLKVNSKNVRKAAYKIDESMKEKFPAKTTSNEVKDELAYCTEVIAVVEKEAHLVHIPAIREKLNLLKEIVEDYTEQLSYSADTDARVGHKTEDSSFFGYKTHIAMNDERIITAAIVTTGEQSDGKYLQELIEKSQATGMEIETVLGDTAYSEKDNIYYAKENKLQLVSKLNPVITDGIRPKEKKFEFNKDANLFVCPAGHLATRKARTGQERKIKERTKYSLIFSMLKNVRFVHFARGVIKKGQRVKAVRYRLNPQNTKNKKRFKIARNSKRKRNHAIKLKRRIAS